jgi:hypothetical protein
MEFIKFIFSNFWIWLGFIIILMAIIKGIYILIIIILRQKILIKHGYPPPHCDADGDLKEKTDVTTNDKEINPSVFKEEKEED